MVSKKEEGVVAKHLLIELLITHSGGSQYRDVNQPYS